MSRVKRQRLTVDGEDRVTAIGDDVVDQSAPTENNDAARPSKEKAEQHRSLFVHSLPASATAESLTVLFSEAYPLKHATVVVDPLTKQSKGFGFVTFADVEDAQSARAAFNGFLLDGKKIKIDFARPRNRQGGAAGSPDPPDVSSPAQSAKDQSSQKPPRLIVRNLPWSIKDADQLSVLFRSFGKVKHATMPKRGPGLSAGFGFVLLRGRKNAEKAMEALNGREIEGRTVAVDWAVDKDTWDTFHRETQGAGSENGVQNGSLHGDNDESNGPESGDVDMVSHSGAEESDNEEDRMSDDGGSKMGSEDDSREEVENDDDDDDEEEEEERPADDNSLTLFVRNLPFTATDDSLTDHFRTFGAVRYARVVIDPATERSKGVGFVCFYNEQDADSCIRAAPRGQTSSNPSQNGVGTSMIKQSLLQDTSLDRSGNYTLDGRLLQISRAVDRKEATRLQFANSSLREVRDKDRRRLYLLAEGNVPSDSPLYQQLPPTEIKMREDSTKQRQSLLRTNPSLHLSLTRLSVRNLPRSIDSRALKLLAREAAVGFAKDVKAGLRKQLTKEELSRGGGEMKEAEQARKSKGKGIVKQAKVVFEGREGTKVTEDSGAGRSRGYGFIEYSSHRWALMGLRWLNAHAVEPSKGSSTGPSQERRKRLIVEFAIENAQVVMRRREKEAKARETSRSVQQRRDAGELPEKARDFTKDQLMAKTRKGVKRKQDRAGPNPASPHLAKASAETEDGRLAKRQQIIGRKRMLRRNRAKVRN